MDREHKWYNLSFCLPCKGWFCSLPSSLSWVISMCWRKVCALCGCCLNFFSTTSIMSADLSITRPAINACCLLPAWMEISFELYLVLQLFVELPSPTPTHYSICFDSLLFAPEEGSFLSKSIRVSLSFLSRLGEWSAIVSLKSTLCPLSPSLWWRCLLSNGDTKAFLILVTTSLYHIIVSGLLENTHPRTRTVSLRGLLFSWGSPLDFLILLVEFTISEFFWFIFGLLFLLHFKFLIFSDFFEM